ncbi:thioredoxin-like protein [Tribonema minus]|uniref:Thioredoxin-like protein n=1 Tax=Tribonema minus TaxID=303371 RepID=A0A836CAV6_9STRA|nr:thioredoxin-like protein [Tribonema minus]
MQRQHQQHAQLLHPCYSFAADDDDVVDFSGAATQERIAALVADNPILVFMKGNRMFPQCGYSGTVVQILNQLGVPYETVDVMADDRIREGVKDFSNWPTIPQLYLNGEFVGGADIVIELYQTGELLEQIEIAAAS